jgi:hypothetical protein
MEAADGRALGTFASRRFRQLNAALEPMTPKGVHGQGYTQKGASFASRSTRRTMVVATSGKASRATPWPAQRRSHTERLRPLQGVWVLLSIRKVVRDAEGCAAPCSPRDHQPRLDRRAPASLPLTFARASLRELGKRRDTQAQIVSQLLDLLQPRVS